MKSKLGLCFLVTAALCLGAVTAQAGVINPSFEDPVGNIQGAPTGWTATSTNVWTDPETESDPAPDGDQYLSVKGGTWVAQVTDIQMEAGMTYTVEVYARGTNASLYLFLDGAQKALTTETSSGWTVLTAGFTCDAADAGKYLEVALNGNNGTTDWQNYDLVTVEVTPEPATMGLLALGGLGVLIRRKR
jgi:hypothetical protein